ncbi:MAG TPA: outer membrane protein assembly factor BamD [Burkholderiaceae bacterium]|nr:outer membrane protein assembly factor BamD [Burkholderiaceae bacterium]
MTRQSLLRLVSAFFLVAALALAGCESLESDETVKWNPDRLYKEAQSEISLGGWQRARNLLEKLEARYPFGRYAQHAQLLIAYTYYKEGETAQALSAADRFLKLNPNHPNVDYVHYLKGLASFNDDLGLFGRTLGQDPSRRDPKAMREAFDAFKELVTRYPLSRYAEDATARMNYLVNALAQSEVHVARYYLGRGAHLAAIQRAQTALRDYHGAPASEEALSILVRAYAALGLTELSADAERVLRKNYPASRFHAEAKR